MAIRHKRLFIGPAGIIVMPKLKKELNLFTATIYAIGVILGAGIYALIGEGAGIAGNSVWLSFVVAAIIASFTGLSYAELSSMFTSAAAEYNYTKKASRRRGVAFSVGWVMIIANIIAASTVSLGFAGYFSSLTGLPIVPVAIAVVLLLSMVNFIGIREATRFNILATFIEFAGLVIIIYIGAPYLPGFFQGDFMSSPTGMAGMLGAVALLFFAFLGFEDIANMSEETRKAAKVIPKALIIALAVSTVLYILVSASAVAVVGPQALANSKAPLTTVAEKAWGPQAGTLLAVIALFSTGNTALLLFIVVSRMLYGMSNDHSLPKFFSRVHTKRRTPHIAILFTTILGVGLVSMGNLKFVALLTDIGIFIGYLAVNLAVIALRYREPNRKRLFRVPVNIGKFPVLPLLGALTTVFMFLYFDLVILLAEAGVIAIGLVLYLVFRRAAWAKGFTTHSEVDLREIQAAKRKP